MEVKTSEQAMEINKIVNWPNFITFLRIPLAILWIANVHNKKMLVVILAVAFFTDYLDGFLARKLNSISAFGKILDPICDKMFVFMAALSYVLTYKASLLAFFLIIMRDLGVATCSIIYVLFFRDKKVDFEARLAGKITTFLQFICLGLFVFDLGGIEIAVILVVIFSFVALYDYVRQAIRTAYGK